jgi:N-acetylated-alpha-linked acidic dipeptidase
LAFLVALLLAAGALAAVAATPAAAPVGYSAAAAASELALEGRFESLLSPIDQRAWMEHMAAAPNQVGSPHDHENAEYIAALARSFGWQVRIETFEVLYPTPLHVALELTAPGSFTAALSEPPVAGDRSSADPRGALPPYVAYGGDGDVSGELVYVNFGMPADYDELARRGIDVRGRIVIARYGGGWRGLKPKLAAEHGAIGCIIYSDPHEDGYFTDDAYPDGPSRPAEGVQRGSVMDITHASGDPLTPGVGATPGALRLAREAAPTLLHIPVLPISAADATPLLRALGGPRAGAAARGALPLTYHLGPGPARVHLVVQSEWSLKTVYDVIAELRGAELPDEWVIRGNHHDGWVFGAVDPLAGQVALLAEMKALGTLHRAGWRPRRTLVYASWDGEEPGLIGSTEWVEQHLPELQSKAVAYVNTDENGPGILGASGCPTLTGVLNDVAAVVRDPHHDSSLLERARAAAAIRAFQDGATEEQRALARRLGAGGPLPLEAPGSGSDFTPFVQHAGIASINFGFGGEQPNGAYHSTYDSFDRFVRVVDPDFGYEVALAAVGGRIVMRLADAPVLPFRFADLATAVNDDVRSVHALADRMREHALELDGLLDAGAFELAASARDPLQPPAREASVPELDFSPLERAAAALATSATVLDERLRGLDAHADPGRSRELATLLRGVEGSLTDPRGLPGRPWYRHLLYAPGELTGYGAKTLPGVREAIEERRWSDAREYILRTAAVLETCRARLDAASAAASPGPGRKLSRADGGTAPLRSNP